MSKHIANLYMASLFVNVNESHLVFEFGPHSENKRYKCRVAEWAEGQLEIVEKRLIQYRMPLIHKELESYFWVKATHLLRAIGLVMEAFQGLYVFEPEFWYITPTDEPRSIEICLADLNPVAHDRVKIQCTNWGIAGESEENRDAFDKILKESELCIPTAVLHEEDTFYAHLVSDATRRPLESFMILVNLHPALEDTPYSQTA